jgi:hypothetical protein
MERKRSLHYTSMKSIILTAALNAGIPTRRSRRSVCHGCEGYGDWNLHGPRHQFIQRSWRCWWHQPGLDSFTLVQTTTNVPARVGTRFGFRYTIHGTPSNSPIVLTMVGEHPPLKDPRTGKMQTRDVYELQSRLGQTYTSYLFEEERESIPGKWKFEVWHKGKKLCEQSFMVVPDAESKGKR